ncbi:putative phosphothreonine lyase domain-containing protein [Methanofollis fontis]|uniref:DUF1917 domain-containing protein n=1 Tax=Methanofollis fontis TaxID=2052832 RepID=A0A483CS30_9EURY|nr:putative phosphothreonine lyase domain-containg protein [Methanofollis fontis]TAJ45638.1 DUF1917 domain-containing protein [Methanofollis fontis]
MDEVDSGALADAAFGIFEILLDKALLAGGMSLHARVEAGIDFLDDFTAVFDAFAGDYPDLAAALIERFSDPSVIYRLLVEGEGVVPSRTTLRYWIIEDNPAAGGIDPTGEEAGKWLIFCDAREVDALWHRIRDATANDDLGISAKVSTAKPNPDSRDERYVIYAYTADWSDEADVMRVREHLRLLGVEARIGYKRNLETFAGEYSEKGKKVTYYSA